jgi:hypothetical protein
MMVLCWSSSSPPLRSSGAWADIATEAIELGDHQHVPGFEAVEETSEPAALRSSDIAGYRLGDHAAGLDLEAGRREFLQLVVRGLTGRRHSEVGEGARHGRISSERDFRILPPVQNPVELFSGQPKKRCP